MLILTAADQEAAARLALARRAYRRARPCPSVMLDVGCPYCGVPPRRCCRGTGRQRLAGSGTKGAHTERRVALHEALDAWRAGLAALG